MPAVVISSPPLPRYAPASEPRPSSRISTVPAGVITTPRPGCMCRNEDSRFLSGGPFLTGREKGRYSPSLAMPLRPAPPSQGGHPSTQFGTFVVIATFVGAASRHFHWVQRYFTHARSSKTKGLHVEERCPLGCAVRMLQIYTAVPMNAFHIHTVCCRGIGSLKAHFKTF